MGVIITHFDLIDNDEFIAFLNSGIYGTYIYLRRHIIRGPMYDPHKSYVYDKYHSKGYLATTLGYRSLGKKFNTDRKVMKAHTTRLKELGVIKTKLIQPPGLSQQTMFILGKWYENYNPLNNESRPDEMLFIDQVFGRAGQALKLGRGSTDPRGVGLPTTPPIGGANDPPE